MHKSRTVYTYAHRILCLIMCLVLSLCIAPTVFADGSTDTSSSGNYFDIEEFEQNYDPTAGKTYTDTVTSLESQGLNRYNQLTNNIAPDGQEALSTGGDLDAVNKTKEEIDIEEFNNSFLDTVIYIIGGLCGIMMLLQITVFAVCKLYPSWNHVLAKLSKIGISGYEDGWLAPTIKILLLGILGYLCISGTMKHLIAFILGWYANVFK